MTIGHVAKQAEVNIQTVRYYERKGLVIPADRTDSGYRTYTAAAVQRIRFIKQAQAIGFTLREIEELLSLRVAQDSTCADIRKRAEDKVTDVDVKILKLQAMRQALLLLIGRCDNDSSVKECPIIEALDDVHTAQSAPSVQQVNGKT